MHAHGLIMCAVPVSSQAAVRYRPCVGTVNHACGDLHSQVVEAQMQKIEAKLRSVGELEKVYTVCATLLWLHLQLVST